MRIAVAGCVHGHFKTLLEGLLSRKSSVSEPQNGDPNAPKRSKDQAAATEPDLLLLCGDVQTPRANNAEDIQSMAMPSKYLGEARQGQTELAEVMQNGGLGVPVIFVGGNHEAYNLLSQLPHGGFVMSDFFYCGRSSLVTYGGLKVAGISGIYKKYDFHKSRNTYPLPLSDQDKYSIYHIQEHDLEMFWKLDEGDVDIVMSHDWPTGLLDPNTEHGPLKKDPDFVSDYKNGRAGVPAFKMLMQHLKPKYWFAAHHHTNFESLVKWPCGKSTRFVATAKVLPGRDFIHSCEIETPDGGHDSKKIAFAQQWVNLHRKYYLCADVQKDDHVDTQRLAIEYREDLGRHAADVKNTLFHTNSPGAEKSLTKIDNKDELALDV